MALEKLPQVHLRRVHAFTWRDIMGRRTLPSVILDHRLFRLEAFCIIMDLHGRASLFPDSPALCHFQRMEVGDCNGGTSGISQMAFPSESCRYPHCCLFGFLGRAGFGDAQASGSKGYACQGGIPHGRNFCMASI